MNDEVTQAVQRLRGMRIEADSYFDQDAIHTVLAALESANERADRAEAALRELARWPEQFCGSSNADHAQLFCECEGLRSFAVNALKGGTNQ